MIDMVIDLMSSESHDGIMRLIVSGGEGLEVPGTSRHCVLVSVLRGTSYITGCILCSVLSSIQVPVFIDKIIAIIK